MADEKPKQTEAEEPKQLSPEAAMRRELASLKATNAPVIYFDVVTSNGAYLGIGNMTLECAQHLVVDVDVMNARQVVAQLRFPVESLPSLKAAIAHIEELTQPIPKEAKN
jgi:hypothetical protein